VLLRDLDDLKAVLSSIRGSLVGVGMTAFSRIIPWDFVNNYRILCARATSDLPILEKVSDIWCLERETGERCSPPGFNSFSLLAHTASKDFLRRLQPPVILFLYQSYPELEVLARREGWMLLANEAALRVRVGDRRFFLNLIRKLGLPLIPGGLYRLEEFLERGYEYWATALGPHIVVQLADVTKGGGKGTFFVSSKDEYQGLKERLKKGYWRDMALEKVILSKKLNAVASSITLCITRHGVLMGPLQLQFIDMEPGPLERGVFCGHSWGGVKWPHFLEEEARAQALLIAQGLRQMGYKGLFGVDFLADLERQKIYPKEINPRLTGGLPMLSMLLKAEGKLPLEAFHLLEFMDITYEIELERLNEEYRIPPCGSHVIVHPLSAPLTLKGSTMRAGVYLERSKGEFDYKGVGWNYSHLQRPQEILLVDGPPEGWLGPLEIKDPLFRLCRILCADPGLGQDLGPSNRLRRAAKWIRRSVLKTSILPSL